MTAGRSFQRLRPGAAGIEVVLADSSHAFGRHMHDEFGIGLIERGAQRSASGRGIVDAHAGDLITVNPGEVHDGRPLDDQGRRWRMLYIPPALLHHAVADMATGDTFEFTAPVIRDPRLSTRFRALVAAQHADAAPLQVEAALLQLVAGVMSPSTAASCGAQADVRLARERIDDDPATSRTLAEMAAEAGLSRLQFLRAFTRLTGLPPHAYQLQRRIQHARRLIRAGVSLAQAAASSGFADQSHMTRCFARHLGLTPGAFQPR